MKIESTVHIDNKLLSREALEFLEILCQEFEAERQRLLEMRADRYRIITSGKKPDFLDETSSIRGSDWQIAPLPADLLDRRVEITGPVDRKMIINALNSGASCFMADFEESNSPTWENQLQGQINLYDAVRKYIELNIPGGKHYRLQEKTAVLLVRPRGWHLDEKHIQIDGKNISGSIFDFALYFFHNAKHLLENGSGPYFYLPKMESYLEARLWNSIFVRAQEIIGIPQGSIKATVLIETIHAAFAMDEILYELKEHSAGLNAGRWDYIFSCIKSFRSYPDFNLADRGLITMQVPFMEAYALLLLKTCHKRGAPAIGGMNAQIPVKNNPQINENAINAVRKDKSRAAVDGYDGAWVAHPGLVDVAMEEFAKVLGNKTNQIQKKRDDIKITAENLLDFQPSSPITEEGLRTNINVSIQYLGSWLAGNGCVPINYLMEDAATAEISRSQVWHWIRSSSGILNNGQKITMELCKQFLQEELEKVKTQLGDDAFNQRPYQKAAAMFANLIENDNFEEFLTLNAYKELE